MKKEDSKESEPFIKSHLSALLFFIFFFALNIVFFFLLDQKTGAGLGLREILYSFVLALVIALALFWVRELMVNNPYLGVIFGLCALVA